MKIRILTHRLNRLNYGEIIEEESPRVNCLLDNAEAEIIEDNEGVEEPVLADHSEEIKEDKAPELPPKKKAGRPKKINI